MRPLLRKLLAPGKTIAARQLAEWLPSGRLLPSEVAASFVNLAAFEPAEFCRRFLPSPSDGPVAVIGCGAGRDSHWLTAHGYAVVSLDLARQDGVALFVRGDMNNLPVRGEAFAAVVMSDVLEHTFDDVAALREARRVVKPGGRLVLNLPLGDDIGDHHVRVYTFSTARRTLAAAGWQMVDKRYRGLLPWIEVYVPGVRAALRAIDALMVLSANRSLLLPMNRAATAAAWHVLARLPLTRFSKRHGVYLCCIPAAGRDFTAVNLAWYERQDASMYGSRATR